MREAARWRRAARRALPRAARRAPKTRCPSAASIDLTGELIQSIPSDATQASIRDESHYCDATDALICNGVCEALAPETDTIPPFAVDAICTRPDYVEGPSVCSAGAYCDPFTSHCLARGDDGAACSFNSGCRSGFCSLSRRCGAVLEGFQLDSACLAAQP